MCDAEATIRNQDYSKKLLEKVPISKLNFEKYSLYTLAYYLVRGSVTQIRTEYLGPEWVKQVEDWSSEKLEEFIQVVITDLKLIRMELLL